MNIRYFLSIIFVLGTSKAILSQEINQLDAEGKRHGLWQKYYDKTEQLRYEGTFEHGKEVGVFKFYRRSGKKQPTATKEFTAGSDRIKVTYFASSGKIISQGDMIGKKREGLWRYFHRDSDKIMSEEHYVNDLIQGEKKVYFLNGKLTELTNYVDGKRHGKSTIYSDRGDVMKEFVYDNNELHGRTVYYDAKGNITIEGTYKRDRKNGLWKYYENGALVEEKTFPIRVKR